MENRSFRKSLAVAVVVLFFGISVIPSVFGDNPRFGKTIYAIYVDDDNTDGPWYGSLEYPYQYIQDGIDASTDGGTIYVCSGNYNEHIKLEKQLFIKGIKVDAEDIPTINGGNDHDTVTIYADGCFFEDFKVRNGNSGFLKKGITLHSDSNVILNCIVFNTGVGILLNESSDNLISNNEMHTGGSGVKIQGFSCNNTFSNNYIHNLSCGIYIDDGSDIIKIYDNLISSNYEYGIRVVHSSNIEIIGNFFSYNNRGGVSLSSSANMTLLNNIFIDSCLKLSGESPIHWNSHVIRNNTINGKMIYYYINQENIILPDDAGQVFVYNCTNVTVENLIIECGGMTIVNSSSSKITGNTIHIQSWDSVGIYLSNTNDSVISKNIIDMYKHGLSTFGINLISSNNNVISKNIVQKGNIGIQSKGENNIISNNSIIDSRLGIVIHKSNAMVSNNNVSDCEYGIYCHGDSHTISDNTVNFNSVGGIFLYCDSCKVTNNYMMNNKVGLEISSDNCIVKNNVIKNNTEAGIELIGSSANILSRNHIEGNQYGIHIYYSLSTIIKSNNFIQNQLAAFFIVSPLNMWINNYWGKPKFGPKIIFGIMVIPLGYPNILPFPVINFDWRPAKKPYNIPTPGVP